MRSWWSPYRCLNTQPSKQATLTFLGRAAGYCATPAFTPLKALSQTLAAHGYQAERAWVPRNCPAGIGGATCQADGRGCSLHNYGLPVDIDPFGLGNDYFRYTSTGRGIPYSAGLWDFTDIKFTRTQIEAAEAIKNTAGERMFRWLGWLIGDTMHIEPQFPPGRAQVDWNTVPEGETETSLKRGDKGNAVGFYQTALIGWDANALPKFGADKDYGGETEGWVKKYQVAAQLEETGQIDGVTADLLGRHHPDSGGGKGEKGDPGTPGQRGAPGADGTDGKDGADGKPASLHITGQQELP